MFGGHAVILKFGWKTCRCNIIMFIHGYLSIKFLGIYCEENKLYN